MKAVILAGGEGTRLRPLTLKLPKAVVPIANIPFLYYPLGLLRNHGINETIVSLGYQPEKVETVLGDGSAFNIKLRYMVEKFPLGTAGAYKNTESLLDGTTIVFNGDILCDFDLTEIIHFHRKRSAVATLVLTRVQDPLDYGLVETKEDGRIKRFLEKPRSCEVTCDTINAGAYILEPQVLEMIPIGENCSFERSVFPALLASRQPVYAYISQGYWIDIGTPEKYLKAHRDILNNHFTPSVVASLSNTDTLATVGAATTFQNSVIDSSVKIGEKVRIHGSSIDQDCQIGNQVVINESVLWKGIKVGDHAELAGCVVGNYCEIGCHAVLSKGVVLGDNCKISDYGYVGQR